MCIAGQQRLQIDYQGLTDRVVKAEKQHASLASQLQQSASCQNQIKASLRNVQRQAGTAESLQAKLQQEVTDLGQAVEQVKGRKGPALPWQRSQEQVSLLLRVGRTPCWHLQVFEGLTILSASFLAILDSWLHTTNLQSLIVPTVKMPFPWFVLTANTTVYLRLHIFAPQPTPAKLSHIPPFPPPPTPPSLLTLSP